MGYLELTDSNGMCLISFMALTFNLFHFFSRFKELNMQKVLWEIVSYIIFLYCLMMIAYSNRDPAYFQMHHHYTKMFLTGSYDGSKAHNWWDLKSVGALPISPFF